MNLKQEISEHIEVLETVETVTYLRGATFKTVEIERLHRLENMQLIALSTGLLSQEVAIKILKSEHLDYELEKKFAQEVFIMRKVRHKNVVQFIGPCTKPPHLCIVTGCQGCRLWGARVKAQTGVMTPETGTYRWMAPKVIEHKPYDHKADVFSLQSQ